MKMVCTSPARGLQPDQDGCLNCPQKDMCPYEFFYNSRLPEGAKVLRKQSDIPRPFTIEPPRPGTYSAGQSGSFGFTLIGRGISYLPYFLLAMRNLGETGMSLDFRKGLGRYLLESVDSVGYGARSEIFSGDTVYNRSIVLKYSDMLKASREHSGNIAIFFTTPAQIKENGMFTAAPSFRGLMGRLISRANALAEFFGSGMLYDHQKVLSILGECRQVSIARARTEEIYAKRHFYNQGPGKKPLAPFFRGEISYSGDFSQDIMALLELGRLIHVGKMVTFGNGRYDLVI